MRRQCCPLSIFLFIKHAAPKINDPSKLVYGVLSITQMVTPDKTRTIPRKVPEETKPNK